MKKILSVIKRIRLSSLLLLIVLFAFGSYSWMVFVTKVSTGLTAHVTAWNFDFISEDESVSTEIVFDVDQIYPGMDDFLQVVTVKNNGELEGELTFEIKKMVVLGQIYEQSETITAEDLMNMMKNDFPFEITVEVDGQDSNIISVGGETKVNIKLIWPFDSGNDELDTKWGEDAYEFYKNNPDGTSVHIELLLKVLQIQ